MRPPLRRLAAPLLSLVLAACQTAAPASTAPAPADAAAPRARGPFVAAANALDVEAGMGVLRRGGSAADAAVAIQAVLGLVEPQSSGLGGGAFLMHYDAETGAVTAYDGRETAPSAATPELFYEDGQPLPFAHGFPVRMLVPGLYGYVSACKWIEDIELTTFDAYDAYWVERDWAREAPVKTQSRIDTPKPFARPKAGTVMVAGVAWAQHRGIDKVEIRVDDGPWQEATLAAEDSRDTWRQWSYAWQATRGGHHLTVRATDRTGEVQTEKRTRTVPDGASGRHSVVVTVDG